jgi:hypothetical protein
MQFPHPIRSIRETILIWAKFLAAFYDVIAANTAAVQQNTASSAEILSALKGLQIDTAQISRAVSYLQAAEKHQRQQDGQPHVFEVIQ